MLSGTTTQTEMNNETARLEAERVKVAKFIAEQKKAERSAALSAEEQAAEIAAEEARMQEMNKALEKRRAQAHKRAPQKVNPQYQSLFSKVMGSMIHDHYSQIGAMLMNVMMDAVTLAKDLVFGTYYNTQKAAFEAAEKEKFSYTDAEGNTAEFTHAYKKCNGQFPPVFPINEETDEVDMHKEPVAEKDVTDELIRMNGYEPEPTVLQGIEDAFIAQIARAEGQERLDRRQKLHLYGYDMVSSGHAKTRDLALESKMVRNNLNRPNPTPFKPSNTTNSTFR